MKQISEYFKFESLLTAVLRDWGTFLFTILALITSLIATGQDLLKLGYQWQNNLFHLTFALALGIPICLAFRIILPRRLYGALVLLLLPGLGYLGAWWAALPGGSKVFPIVQLILLAHLFVAVAPQIARRQRLSESDSSIWNFNWFLFQRFILANLTATILSLAGVLALWSLKSLFNLSIPSEWYSWVTLICFFPIQTVMVLMSLNSYEDPNFQKSHRPDDSTILLMTRWLFAPITVIYIAILYVYIAKILISGIWPQGQVGGLVSGLTAVIFIGFILQPPTLAMKEKALSLIDRWSFPLLIPCLMILLVALLKRISVYGWTPSRYVFFVLALWALALCFWFIRRQARHKLVVPLSLFFLLIATWIGPLSPRSVGLTSQTGLIKQKLALLDHAWTEGVDSVFEMKSTPQRKKDIGLQNELVWHFCRQYGPIATLTAFGAPPSLISKNRGDIDLFFKAEEPMSCYSHSFNGRSVMELLGFRDEYSTYDRDQGHQDKNEESEKPILKILRWDSRAFQIDGDIYAWIGPSLTFKDNGSDAVKIGDYLVSVDYSFQLSMKKVNSELKSSFTLKDVFTESKRKHVFEFDQRTFELIMIQGTYDPNIVIQNYSNNLLLILKKNSK